MSQGWYASPGFFCSWVWGGSLFARGVLASGSPGALATLGTSFASGAGHRPFLSPVFFASTRRFQPFKGLSRPAFANGLGAETWPIVFSWPLALFRAPTFAPFAFTPRGLVARPPQVAASHTLLLSLWLCYVGSYHGAGAAKGDAPGETRGAKPIS